MTVPNLDDLDLTPRSRTRSGDDGCCCFPKPPKFSPVFNTPRSFSQFQSATSKASEEATVTKKEEQKPVNEIEFEQAQEFEGSLPELYDTEDDTSESTRNVPKGGSTLVEAQQVLFLGIIQFFLSFVLLGKKWGSGGDDKKLLPHSSLQDQQGRSTEEKERVAA